MSVMFQHRYVSKPINWWLMHETTGITINKGDLTHWSLLKSSIKHIKNTKETSAFGECVLWWVCVQKPPLCLLLVNFLWVQVRHYIYKCEEPCLLWKCVHVCLCFRVFIGKTLCHMIWCWERPLGVAAGCFPGHYLVEPDVSQPQQDHSPSSQGLC